MEEPKIGARLVASLSYLNILFLISLVMVDEDDMFGAFHVRYGFMIFCLTIIGNVVLLMLDSLAQGYIYPYAGRAFNILIVVACVYGIINALRGKMRPIWGISYLLEKFPI